MTRANFEVWLLDDVAKLGMTNLQNIFAIAKHFFIT